MRFIGFITKSNLFFLTPVFYVLMIVIILLAIFVVLIIYVTGHRIVLESEK
jgi:hypothetical protein